MQKEPADSAAHLLSIARRREELYQELLELRDQPRTKETDARKREVKQLLRTPDLMDRRLAPGGGRSKAV